MGGCTLSFLDREMDDGGGCTLHLLNAGLDKAAPFFTFFVEEWTREGCTLHSPRFRNRRRGGSALDLLNERHHAEPSSTPP